MDRTTNDCGYSGRARGSGLVWFPWPGVPASARCWSRERRRAMGRILVIDDDEMVRGIIRTALERAGYAVVEAENGESGLAAFDAASFDLVITDLLMPEKEGVETVREIRRRSSSVKI